MNAGISFGIDALYVAASRLGDDKPSYYKSTVDIFPPNRCPDSGYIWNQIEDEELRKTVLRAEKVALTIPARICFSKRVFLDSKLNREIKDYQEWFARNQLPGNISNYIYGYIPMYENQVTDKIEALFYATISEHFWPLFYAVSRDDVIDRISLIPEFAALYQILKKSFNYCPMDQAGLINLNGNGAAAVFVKDSALIASRYLPLYSENTEELKSDLEALFLSLMDSDKPTDILIAGGEETHFLKLDYSSKIRYNRISAGFISALGSLEFINEGRKCELPAAG